MDFLIDPLDNLKPYIDLKKDIEDRISPIGTYGIIEENYGHIIYGIINSFNKQNLIITYDDLRARNIYQSLKGLGEKEVYILPRRELLLYDIDALSNETTSDRLNILSKLVEGSSITIVATTDTLLDQIMSKDIYEENSFEFKLEDSLDLDRLVKIFIDGGYERVPMVEGTGQFSLRGGIIDFFPADKDLPYRIELFDDEIDSIRSFDPMGQRSIDILDRGKITPVREVLILEQYAESIKNNLSKDMERLKSNLSFKDLEIDRMNKKFIGYIEKLEQGLYISNRDLIIPYIPGKYLSNIVEYLKEDSLIFIDEPRRIDDRISFLEDNFTIKYSDLYEIGELLYEHKDIYNHYEDIQRILKKKQIVFNSALLTSSKNFEARTIHNFKVKSSQDYHNKIEILKDDIEDLRYRGYKISILSGTMDRARRLSALLLEKGIESVVVQERNRIIKTSELLITEGNLEGGFEYPDIKFAIISDKDIFGSTKRKRKKIRKEKKSQVSFTDLNVGDFVVHENHGIGQYEGVEQLDIQGIKKDYLTISYRGQDKLYVPIDQMSLIQKYIGADGIKPKINKLASVEWAKTKQKAKKAVEDMAEELLELYAKREELEGFKFSEDNDWQRQFEDIFPYEETDGQLRSIEEIKKDMESSKPMDRLLCGDVGYGKTEVALRAAFKAVLDGKQVAFLVPTTILAQQHYNTIMERFSNFPVKLSLLSRFKSKAQQNLEIENIRKGQVDIVVGTHRLLSKDVVFKDLGLLIIDEEQRFGVKHKEVLKQLKESIDVLTLTATPIPRTLHMSLSGIRDMSVIEDPPEERYPVQTYVVEYNPQMIRDAILKEINRDGQVYFVYNRVGSIDKMAADLKKLVPEANFAVAHGQMGEKALEKVMVGFYEKEYDVLVCTTIIETGLDIPNVNTIIIYDADKMGLSQLYQLRGRVGRSNRIGYGYFTYGENKVLTEIAEKRLRAIKEFTEFGSGFKIAMRDLEIRGAGNLLGLQQHGQIEAIGYDLYVKYLNEAIMRLKGREVEILEDTLIDLDLDGYIRDRYIKDEEQKIEVYKKIAAISDIVDYRELLDELIDRFGEPPKEVENLMEISYLRALGSRNKIKNIAQKGREVLIEFSTVDKLSPELIHLLSTKYNRSISFNVSATPSFKYRIKSDVIKDLKILLEEIDSFNGENNI